MTYLLFTLAAILATTWTVRVLLSSANELLEFLGVLLAIGTVIASAVLLITAFFFVAAGHKADIMNKEFGTSYGRNEIFYASDLINEIQRMKYKCVELDKNQQ